MKKSTLIIALGVLFCSCSQYKPVLINAEFPNENCAELKQFITTHWYKHKDKLLYKYEGISKEKFVSEVSKTYKECFYHLTMNEVKMLFGEPNEEIPNDALIYKLSEECFNSVESCDLLMIGFNNTTLNPLFLMNQ